MIHIVIGTGGNMGGVGVAKFIRSAEAEFATVDEAMEFLAPFKKSMSNDSWKTIEDVLVNGCGEGTYVDPELEIYAADGSYTNLFICIEGRQDPN
jgi:hypothetical protein